MPKLLEIAAEYAHLKGIEPKPVMIAMAKLIQICGDKDIQSYDRKDARAFVDGYGKIKTTTIRRRLNSINAVFNWAAYQLDLEQRNPFARLIIREEGRDAYERQPFSANELANLYRRSLSFGKLRLILPVLGETGCRLSEVLGAMKQFIEDCGMSPEASAKSLARFLTERGVQTPSGRSAVWQATTVKRMKARW